MVSDRTLRALALALAVAVGACSPQAGADAQVATATQGSAAEGSAAESSTAHPVSGLEVIPLTVTSGAAVHSFRVEVAATAEEQRQGLMFRTAMGADEGMIFPLERLRYASFWMRNTVIPLDIIFIGADNRILNIHDNAVPYSEESLPSAGPAKAVLELNGGRAQQLGIAPGDLVDW